MPRLQFQEMRWLYLRLATSVQRLGKALLEKLGILLDDRQWAFHQPLRIPVHLPAAMPDCHIQPHLGTAALGTQASKLF